MCQKHTRSYACGHLEFLKPRFCQLVVQNGGRECQDTETVDRASSDVCAACQAQAEYRAQAQYQAQADLTSQPGGATQSPAPHGLGPANLDVPPTPDFITMTGSVQMPATVIYRHQDEAMQMPAPVQYNHDNDTMPMPMAASVRYCHENDTMQMPPGVPFDPPDGAMQAPPTVGMGVTQDIIMGGT